MLRLVLFLVLLSLPAVAERPWLVWEVQADPCAAVILTITGREARLADLRRTLTPEEVQALHQRLGPAPGDYDGNEEALLTHFTLDGASSVWKGLGPSQGKVALALIEDPAVGPLVRKGLEQLNNAKGVPVEEQIRRHPGPLCPLQILLEHRPSSVAVAWLRYQYPAVHFREMPTMNGFYVVGKREDVLAIRQRVTLLDRP